MYLNINNFRSSSIFYIILILIGIVLGTFSHLVFALSSDSEKTLHIIANSSLFNYKSGLNTYEGDVKADQGTTHLMADRVITKNNSKHKIEEAFAYGLTRLAEYTTIPREGDKLFQAKAKIMKFYPLQSVIILEGNVIVTQGENSFKGERIIYNTKDQTISAPPSKGSKATIIIQPNKLS